MVIPKIVHRIWFNLGKNPKPPAKYDDYRSSVENLNPNYEYMEWDRSAADRLIKESYPEHWKTWIGYKSEIYRIDAIRYFIMHKYGGIYIDQDIKMYRPFDELLADYHMASMIFVFSGHSKTTVCNYFMASEKDHPFWMQCILGLAKMQKMPFFHRKQSYFGVFFVSGPFFLNTNLLRWSKQNSWKRTSVNKHPSKVYEDPKDAEKRIVLLYKEAFYNPSNKNKGKQQKSILKTYGHHDYVFSWNPGVGVSPDYAVIFASVIVLIVIVLIIVFSIASIRDFREYRSKRSNQLKDDFTPDEIRFRRDSFFE